MNAANSISATGSADGQRPSARGRRFRVIALVLVAVVPRVVVAVTVEVNSVEDSRNRPRMARLQRLDAAGWTREINKMVGWGATVADNDKDALIAFLARTFNNNRPRPASSKALPEGKGMDVFQVSCLNCHDEKPAAALKLDRAGWPRVLDRMMNWGAHIPADRKYDLIEYLLKGF